MTSGERDLDLQMPAQELANPTTEGSIFIKAVCFYPALLSGADKPQFRVRLSLFSSLLSGTAVAFKCIIFKFEAHRLKSFIPTSRTVIKWVWKKRPLCNHHFSHSLPPPAHFFYYSLFTHQTRIGIVQSVIQGLSLEYPKQCAMVKLARISSNELLDAKLLRTVCI